MHALSVLEIEEAKLELKERKLKVQEEQLEVTRGIQQLLEALNRNMQMILAVVCNQQGVNIVDESGCGTL